MNFITTVIPVFNGEPHITDALDSLVRQSLQPNRVVVLDDCSTDMTAKIVRKYEKQLPIDYRLNNPAERGLWQNHNRGLMLATETDYLHYLHVDDILNPDFYSKMIHPLGDVDGMAMACCQADLIDEHGKPLPAIVKNVNGPSVIVSLDEFLKQRAQLRADTYISGTVIKTNRQSIACQWPLNYKQLGDQYFWAQLACACKTRVRVQKTLLKFRHHSLTQTAKNSKNLDTYIYEDWNVIQGVESMRGKTGFEHWLRLQKLKCFFAALTHVKIKLVQGGEPEYSRQVARAGRKLVAMPHWWLGKAAFYIREWLRAINNS